PAEDMDAYLHVRRVLQNPVVWIDGDVPRPAKGVDDELRIGSDDVHPPYLGFTIGLNAQLDGHVEEVEVLLDFTDGTKSLVIAEAIHSVLIVEHRSAGAIEPLSEKWRELLLRLCFGELLKITRFDRFICELRKCGTQNLREAVVADFPSQHVKHH